LNEIHRNYQSWVLFSVEWMREGEKKGVSQMNSIEEAALNPAYI
jgi:hypothetical protein